MRQAGGQQKDNKNQDQDHLVNFYSGLQGCYYEGVKKHLMQSLMGSKIQF